MIAQFIRMDTNVLLRVDLIRGCHWKVIKDRMTLVIRTTEGMEIITQSDTDELTAEQRAVIEELLNLNKEITGVTV